ncbi:hypothetical protein EV360DRAFT_90166 [Lentinula raphanica]|nr:hypothetical protein EV360DRAFT_90166 [Lentinula raphanica]
MSLRRAPSLATVVAKGRRIAQLSRQVEEMQQQLKDAEVEMDELMNAESQRLQSLENDKTQLFKDKNGAELKAAKLQRQYTQSQVQLKALQRTASEVTQDKDKAEVKAEMLLARVAELEAQLREAQEIMKTDVASSGSKSHGESECVADGNQIQPEMLNVEGPQHARNALPMQDEFGVSESAKGSTRIQPEMLNVEGPQQARDALPMQDEFGVSESAEGSTSIPNDLGGVRPLTLENTKNIAITETHEEQAASYLTSKVEVAPDRSTLAQPEEVVAGPKTKLIAYPEDALHSKNASSWFPAAFKYVNVDLSEQYLALVHDYIAFEGAKDWSSSPKGLPAKDRPKELTRWIAGCRYERAGSEPNLKKEELDRFSQWFMVWWTSLKSSSLEKVSGKGRKSTSLNIGGKNGWLSIVACIKW